MKSFPIKTMNEQQAKEYQFKLIDEITHIFKGEEILNLGDLGVVQPLNQPILTQKVEQVLANFFGTQSALLVRGAGTGALRFGLFCALKDHKEIIIHDAPIYPTTKVTLDALGAKLIKCDFNDINKLNKAIKENPSCKVALVQYTRQKPDDSYDYQTVIKTLNDNNVLTITDDNYAAMKVLKLGASFANCISTFSCFKVQGPEGVGLILGAKEHIEEIKKMNYSGGSQVQGHEAQSVLRGLIYAPVSLAISSAVVDEVVDKINNKQIKGIKDAFVANAQSKVIIVNLKEPIAQKVLEQASILGACPNPVGAESKYEFVPMFYKVSGTFILDNPKNKEYMIRINPMRAGAKTVISILERSIDNVLK